MIKKMTKAETEAQSAIWKIGLSQTGPRFPLWTFLSRLGLSFSSVISFVTSISQNECYRKNHVELKDLT